jgi:Reverse transcriptase (RNA-dependent DNA polymerase)
MGLYQCNALHPTDWEMDTMVPKQAGFYGEPFAASRGVRQGDIISPMIFNIVTDAIIRECEGQFLTNDISRRLDVLFYADDGMVVGKNPSDEENLLNLYTKKLPKLDLK